MKINGCVGCWRGGKDIEQPCSQHDDMEQIYPLYKEADVVVLASPLYYWFISGLKSFLYVKSVVEHYGLFDFALAGLLSMGGAVAIGFKQLKTQTRFLYEVGC